MLAIFLIALIISIFITIIIFNKLCNIDYKWNDPLYLIILLIFLSPMIAICISFPLFILIKN